MDTAALITKILNFTDNYSQNDVDVANRRLRILQYAQETVDEVWNWRDWTWTYKSATLVVTTSGSKAMPSDFLELGPQGGVFNDDTDRVMEEIPIEHLLRIRERGLDNERIFTMYDFDTTTNVPMIQLSNPSASKNLKIFYRKVPPTLVDSSTTSGLENIPVQHHNTVLITGTAAKTRRSKGDTRDYQADYLKGLARMTSLERSRKTSAQRLPRAISNW